MIETATAFTGNALTESVLPFQCNACGTTEAGYTEHQLTREAAPCRNCGRNVRERALLYLISRHLLGCSVPLPQWPVRPEIKVLGISDGGGLAAMLATRFDYENTSFHVAPFFDIKSPPPQYLGTADIVVCSEVLEHVAPPIAPAFQGLFSILRPGGLLVFSVPWTRTETVEHFPELNDWHIEQEGSQKILRNRTADGRAQVFRNLRFHGGVGATLEMRIFGILDLLYQFAATGFSDIRIMYEDVLENGIRIGAEISRPFTCRKYVMVP